MTFENLNCAMWPVYTGYGIATHLNNGDESVALEAAERIYAVDEDVRYLAPSTVSVLHFLSLTASSTGRSMRGNESVRW